MFRSLTRGQLAFDVIVPGVLFLLSLLSYSSIGLTLVVLGMCLALALWRLNTGLSLAVAWLTAILQMLSMQQPDVSNLAIFVVLYATTSQGDRTVKWLGFVSTFVGAALIAVYISLWPGLRDGFSSVSDIVRASVIAFAGFLALFLLSWTLGLLRRAYLNARDSRRAQAEAEAEKERARQDVSVEQERTRIARDMHDVVAHSLAVVIAQADGARYARATDPEAVDSALTTISATARDALGDVRVLLAQLRHSQVEGPQPVLADLDRLVEQMRATGLRIDFAVIGQPAVLGTSAQLAMFRIVQEALTNALRHGDTQRAVEVRVRWRDESVEATIANSTASVDTFVPGHGLAGMRERATLVGGLLHIEATAGTFSVSVSVPRTPDQTMPEMAIERAVMLPRAADLSAP